MRRAAILNVRSPIGDDPIYALQGADSSSRNLSKGRLIYGDQTVLHGSVELIFTPNGNLITANADPATFSPSPTDSSEFIEIMHGGSFVRKFFDRFGGRRLFGGRR